MTTPAITISPEESVAVASRTLTHYNIGMLPVCASDGLLQGVLTDRDIVTRCLAGGRDPKVTTVRDIMTTQVRFADPNMEVGAAAHLMGRQQIRRLPVVEQGRLCGMLSLGDLANQEETVIDAADALSEITSNISFR
jgi:CBS domain-containing protein